MKIVVPVDDGRLAEHFGRSQQVALFTVDQPTRRVIAEQTLEVPPHEPELYPAWLKEQGADVVIAGGMGGRAIVLFERSGIRVVVGAPPLPARELVDAMLAGELDAGVNVCQHGPDHRCSH
jgi:predicted Fe-Mo cluster-binding NifX family protein